MIAGTRRAALAACDHGRGATTRGAGAVTWGGALLDAYYAVSGAVTRVRLSADNTGRVDVIEGQRVTLALPGAEPADELVVRVRREPPFVWAELTRLAPVASRAG